jgi:hypothetical protein
MGVIQRESVEPKKFPREIPRFIEVQIYARSSEVESILQAMEKIAPIVSRHIVDAMSDR